MNTARSGNKVAAAASTATKKPGRSAAAIAASKNQSIGHITSPYYTRRHKYDKSKASFTPATWEEVREQAQPVGQTKPHRRGSKRLASMHHRNPNKKLRVTSFPVAAAVKSANKLPPRPVDLFDKPTTTVQKQTDLSSLPTQKQDPDAYLAVDAMDSKPSAVESTIMAHRAVLEESRDDVAGARDDAENNTPLPPLLQRTSGESNEYNTYPQALIKTASRTTTRTTAMLLRDETVEGFVFDPSELPTTTTTKELFPAECANVTNSADRTDLPFAAGEPYGGAAETPARIHPAGQKPVHFDTAHCDVSAIAAQFARASIVHHPQTLRSVGSIGDYSPPNANGVSGFPGSRFVITQFGPALLLTADQLSYPNDRTTESNAATKEDTAGSDASLAMSAAKATASCARPARLFKHWTSEENALLQAAVEMEGGGYRCKWNKIAHHYFGNSRTSTQCKARWKKAYRPGVSKDPWTEAEDQAILDGVNQGLSWSKIAAMVPNRVCEQVRHRYSNVIDPSLITKATWTEAERNILYSAQKQLGNRWSEIAKLLPGRSEQQVKNFWYSAKARQRRLLRREAIEHEKQQVLARARAGRSTSTDKADSSPTSVKASVSAGKANVAASPVPTAVKN